VLVMTIGITFPRTDAGSPHNPLYQTKATQQPLPRNHNSTYGLGCVERISDTCAW
jgi:hypothetical protein